LHNAHCFAFVSVSAFKACRARLYRQSVHAVLIPVCEAVTDSERVLGPMLFKHILTRSLSTSILLRFHLGLAVCPPCLRVCRRPPGGRPGPSLSSSSLQLRLQVPSPSPSPSSSLSRLRVTGLRVSGLAWSLLFCVRRSVGYKLP
jgi:hypothetical protein